MNNFISRLFKKIIPPDCQRGVADHKWINYAENRHFWTLFEDGSSTGMYNLIDDRLKWEKRKDQQAVFNQMLKDGFNAYHTNLLWWRCSECGIKGGFTERYLPYSISLSDQQKGKRAIEAVVEMVT